MNTTYKVLACLMFVLAFGPVYPPEYLKEKTGDDVELYKMADAIIRAESGWKTDVKNKGSSASGLFQFINKTFFDFCITKYNVTDSMEHKNDPFVQIDCGVAMLSDGLSDHWLESKKYWRKFEKLP